MKINYAMDCDINGVPWGMVDALYDFGIKGFSMAINEFYSGMIEYMISYKLFIGQI